MLVAELVTEKFGGVAGPVSVQLEALPVSNSDSAWKSMFRALTFEPLLIVPDRPWTVPPEATVPPVNTTDPAELVIVPGVKVPDAVMSMLPVVLTLPAVWL